MSNGTRINTFFTSDLHLGHTSVLYFYEKRRNLINIDFEFLKENKAEATKLHDDYIIDLWNSTIKKDDFVYYLGDFSLANKEHTEEYLKRMNGRKYFIKGNHDKSCEGLEQYFTWIGDIKEAKFNNNQYKFIDPSETFCVEMCHYPLLNWNRRPHGTICLHGHCHGSLDNYNNKTEDLRVDVGFGASLANYSILSLETLYNYFRNMIESKGFNTFQEYHNYIARKDGYEA